MSRQLGRHAWLTMENDAFYGVNYDKKVILKREARNDV